MSLGNPGTPRSFGLLVGGAFCVLAALMIWRGHSNIALAFGSLGAVLFVCGLLYPPILVGPSRLWWRVSHAIAAFNTRVLLTLLFAVAFIPLSLIWRAIGTDPLARRRDQWKGWTPYPSRYRDGQHYLRMY